MKVISCFLFLFLLGNSTKRGNTTTTWKLVQHRYTSHGCIDTSAYFSWKYKCISNITFNRIHGEQNRVLEENIDKINFFYISLSGKKHQTDVATVQGSDVVSYNLKTRTKSKGKIVKRTAKFLFLSWVPGSIDIYQNTAFSADSVSIGVINESIIESGRLFGKTITYCR